MQVDQRVPAMLFFHFALYKKLDGVAVNSSMSHGGFDVPNPTSFSLCRMAAGVSSNVGSMSTLVWRLIMAGSADAFRERLKPGGAPGGIENDTDGDRITAGVGISR